MTGLPPEVDIAVIGGGAAGIAAARHIAETGSASLLVLEGRDRPGGRAWTVASDGHPMDLGCEWLHSADRNPLALVAEERGFTLNQRRPDWSTRLARSGESLEAQEDWLREHEAFYWAVHHAAQEAEDRSAASVLAPGGRWNQLLDAISTWANAVELECLSVKDNDRYEDSGINWRLHEGYGRLLAAIAEDLPVAYGAAVSRIEHGGRQIRIVTSRGTVEAAKVIVTLPTDAIAREDVVFSPPLPDKVAAAAGLPLGLADKLFLHLDGLPDTEEELFLIGATNRRETMSYQIRPMGVPHVRCFFGGRFAAQLERDGIAAMAAFATDELAGLFGNGIRRRLRPIAASFWRADPFARGSYSYALPGHADDRARLAAPVEDRLFFAGEACSPNFFSTAHGAWLTGRAAAAAALASLAVRGAARAR